MAKVLRLDLGEPLVSDLDDFCKAKHRKKTQLIRELVSDYLEKQMKNSETRERIERVRAARTQSKSNSS
jgi:metal-responsive CopG/Arc/MetJ family transcriptional regulator